MHVDLRHAGDQAGRGSAKVRGPGDTGEDDLRVIDGCKEVRRRNRSDLSIGEGIEDGVACVRQVTGAGGVNRDDRSRARRISRGIDRTVLVDDGALSVESENRRVGAIFGDTAVRL